MKLDELGTPESVIKNVVDDDLFSITEEIFSFADDQLRNVVVEIERES